MPKILIIHGAGMNMRGKVQLEAGVGEHDTLGNRTRLPAASAQGIEERRRRVGTRETVLVRQGRERHVPMVTLRGQGGQAVPYSAAGPLLSQRAEPGPRE